MKKFKTSIAIIILSLCIAGCSKDITIQVKTISMKHHVNTYKHMESSALKKEPEQNAGIVINKQVSKDISQKIREYLIAHNVNGSIEVVRKNVVLFKEGIGFSNIAKKTINQSMTTYPIGSITKTFVATSIMQLQEQHKLNINDPVAKYIPNFPIGKRILLSNLLSHTSGIQPLHWKRGDTKPENLVREIERRPLKFSPGTKWDYEDANYMVLGYILEKVTGISLHAYIQKNIFNKSGMSHSGFITPDKLFPYNSIGYLKNAKNIISTRVSNPYILYGCGDIYATTDDLRLYDQALLNGKLVTSNSLKQILTPKSKSRYGFGLYNNGNAVYSRGVLGGFDTAHFYYNDDTSVVVLLNIRNKQNEIYNITNGIHNLLKG